MIAIDRRQRTVSLDDGSRLPYAKCLLATGRVPRRLQVVPELEGVVYVLRDVHDAEALRARQVPGAHLAIIGGGFIGLKVAASARALGADATVIEILPRLLGRCVPAPIAARLAHRHAVAGIEIILGCRIEQIGASVRGAAIRLEDGRTIEADAVLVGIGAAPRTELAEAAGLAVDRGILVDETLRTSDPDIFAAGDVTACPTRSATGPAARSPGTTPRSRARAPPATCSAPASAAAACPGSGRISTSSRSRWRAIRSAHGTRSNVRSATTGCCSSTSPTTAGSSA